MLDLNTTIKCCTAAVLGSMIALLSYNLGAAHGQSSISEGTAVLMQAIDSIMEDPGTETCIVTIHKSKR